MSIRYIINYSIVFILLFGSIGCTSFNIKSDYSLNQSADNGLLVFSFTTNDEVDGISLLYRSTNSSVGGDIASVTFKNPLDWTTPKGRLVTIELPAGAYEFYKWSMPMVGESKKKFSIPFTIMPGKALYIGNVHFDIHSLPFVYKIYIKDTSERDLVLLKQRFVNIKDNDISTDISKLNYN